jgi:hypothetical protein
MRFINAMATRSRSRRIAENTCTNKKVPGGVLPPGTIERKSRVNRELRGNTYADREVIAGAVFAVGDVRIRANLKGAFNGGVLIDPEAHRIRRRSLLGLCRDMIGLYCEGKRRFPNGSDLSGHGLRLRGVLGMSRALCIRIGCGGRQ